MGNRLGLTQEIGSVREEGTILLPGPAIGPILWNDFTKSKIQTKCFNRNVYLYLIYNYRYLTL